MQPCPTPGLCGRITTRTLATGALLVSFLLSLSGCGLSEAFTKSDVDDDTGALPIPPLDLSLCRTSVSNAPAASSGRVNRQSALACMQDVEVLVAPAPEACITSGFGPRRGRLHKGIDYQSKPAGPVVAAADGTVVRRKFRQKDYGHWIVVDHGNGVHTGYAHLAGVTAGIDEGVSVRRGQVLGTMGNTGNAARAVHLHIEYRIGDLSNRQGWWGLTPIDPFMLPGKCPAS